jgi:multimeric flavodoxin WrbA
MERPEIYTTKVGAAVAVGGTRHGGQEITAGIILNQFISRGILAVGGGGAYNGGIVWSLDKRKEGAEEDEVGIDSVRIIGKMLAEAAWLVKTGRDAFNLDIPDAEVIYGKGISRWLSTSSF